MNSSEQPLKTAGYRTQPLVVPGNSCYGHGHGWARVVSFAPQVHKEERVKVPMRDMVCHVCGKSSQIPAAALSAQCVHCHAYFETTHYVLHSGTRHRILHSLGNVIVPGGVELSHLDVMCSDLVISGKVSGRFCATQRLELRGRARIKGELSADFLSVPSGASVTVAPSVMVRNAELRGELRGRLIAKGQVHVYSNGRLLGTCRAEKLLLDPGAEHEGGLLT